MSATNPVKSSAVILYDFNKESDVFGFASCPPFSSISFNLVRVPYDIEKEIKYLEESDMPNKEIIIQSLKTANH